jgi:hypothetical protein
MRLSVLPTRRRCHARLLAEADSNHDQALRFAGSAPLHEVRPQIAEHAGDGASKVEIGLYAIYSRAFYMIAFGAGELEMDLSTSDLLTQLPKWLYWPLFAVALATYLSTSLRSLIGDALPRRRLITRERERLELLKLWYEVEEAHRASLERGDKREPPSILSQPVAQLAEPKKRPRVARLDGKTRAIYGAIGGAGFPIFTNLLQFLPLFLSTSSALPFYGYAVGMFGKALLLGAIGASLAYFSRSRDRLGAAIIGTLPAFLLDMGVRIYFALPETSMITGPHS